MRAEESLTPARTDATPVAGARRLTPQPASLQSDASDRSAPHRPPLSIDALSLDETAQRICALLAAGQSAQVVTLNPELVMRARRDIGLARVIRAARIVTADGAGVVWALRLASQRIPARVTGVDLALALAQRAAVEGYPVFLLWAGAGVAQDAAQVLTQRAPGLRIAGCWAGSPRPGDDAEATARIRASGARLALVAYGAPAQELWIARNLPALPGVVAMGVGGALDMLSGRITRAPRWMRAAGLEWLFRLAQEPWRWRRMLALPRFALTAGRAAALVWLTRTPDAGILAIRDSAKAARAGEGASRASRASKGGAHHNSTHDSNI